MYNGWYPIEAKHIKTLTVTALSNDSLFYLKVNYIKHNTFSLTLKSSRERKTFFYFLIPLSRKFFCLASETLKGDLKGRHWSPSIPELLLKAFEYDNISFCILMSMIILHFPWGKWSAGPSYCRKSIDKNVRILRLIVYISCYHFYNSNRLSPEWRLTPGGRAVPIRYQ